MPTRKKNENISTESLKQLTSEAFIPSIILILTKVVGMLVLPTLLGYHYQIVFNWTLSSFPITLLFGNEEQVLIVNSYTNLAMYGVIFLGFFWVIIRSYHFHDSHIKPKTTTKLAELKMLHLITTSFEVYHSAFVWFCFMWLSVIITTVYYLMALSFMWVFLAVFLTSVLMTYLLIDDLEKEFYIWRLFNENQ